VRGRRRELRLRQVRRQVRSASLVAHALALLFSCVCLFRTPTTPTCWRCPARATLIHDRQVELPEIKPLDAPMPPKYGV